MLLAGAGARAGPTRVPHWLFTAHPATCALEPVGLVWYSDRLLDMALDLLRRERANDMGRRKLNEVDGAVGGSPWGGGTGARSRSPPSAATLCIRWSFAAPLALAPVSSAIAGRPPRTRATVAVGAASTAVAPCMSRSLAVADVLAMAKVVVGVGGRDEEQHARARAVARVAIETHWKATTAAGAGVLHAPVGSGTRLPAALRALAVDAGTRAAAQSHAVGSYLLSTLYTCMLPARLRSALGVFFTPPPVVDRLLDLVEVAGVDWRTVRAVDPAAGGGAFLTPLTERIVAAYTADGATPADILDAVARQVRGIEIDPFSAWMSAVFLEIAVWPLCERAQRRMPTLIVTRDALTVDAAWPAGATLVIGNPPYGKVTPSAAHRARYGRSLFGHAHLYGMFMDLAVQLSAPGAVIGLVTPTSFLGGQYFKQLRHVLATEAPPVTIDFVTDRAGVFADVLQETALSVFTVGRARREVQVSVLTASNLAEPCAVTAVGRVPLPTCADTPWLLPRQPDDVALVSHVARMPHRLADAGYRVSTGPLVWNRHRDQLTARRTRGAIPLLWADVILPAGVFCDAPTESARPAWITVRRDQAHLVTREPGVLVQRTTAKEQRRRLVAAVLDDALLRQYGGVVLENHVNLVRPVGPAAPSDGPAISVHAIAAVLNSEAADRVFRCISGSVAVSAYELEALPFPAPTTLRQLDTLLACHAPSTRSRPSSVAPTARRHRDPARVAAACRPVARDSSTAGADLPGGHGQPDVVRARHGRQDRVRDALHRRSRGERALPASESGHPHDGCTGRTHERC